METDSFFYQLFSQLPQAFFELIDLPAGRANAYRFESVELKKSLRIDGLFLPKKRTLPVYFVEVQFQRRPRFYANLFAKVFCYLDENDPKQEWVAVAVFPTRREEPVHLAPYEDLLASKRVKRIYLEEIANTSDFSVGIGLLQLLFATEQRAEQLAPLVVEKSREEMNDSVLQAKVVELVERLLMTRFTGYDVEGIRMKFKLHDIRKSKAWQQLREEGHNEGREEGREEGKIETKRELVQKWIAKGMTANQIAELLEIDIREVRRLSNGKTH